MYIDGDRVLHIVDDGTHFSAAAFLLDVSTKTIWKTLLLCWSTIYTGLPNRILVDPGSTFGDLFINIATDSNIEVDRAGVEAHSSLGIGERYHHSLRQTYRKIMATQANTKKNLAVAVSVKAMKDTLGSEGLVPSALVFEEFPPVHTKSEIRDKRMTLAGRAAIANTARLKIQRVLAKLKIDRALQHQVPITADATYQPGDRVLVWRENIVKNRIGEGIGPFSVSSVDSHRKLLFVQDVKIGAATPFGWAQVNRYLEPESVAHSFFVDLQNAMAYFKYAEEKQAYLTEIIHPSDSHASSTQMTNAKKDEIKGILDRGTFQVILREDLPHDANVLPGKFVLAIKLTEDRKVNYRARYVIGGHRDKLKKMVVHSASTLQLHSIRLLIALAVIHGFDVWTSDIPQAYLQPAEPVSRQVFITKPVPEFKLDPTECLQLLKPLYGLCESGDHWYRTLDNHHQRDPGMTPMRSDPALYTIMKQDLLQGLSDCYVDDWIRAGNDDFKSLCNISKQKFQMTDDQHLPCTLTGFSLSRQDDSTILQNQHGYRRMLEELQPNANFSSFRSIRMKLAWLSNTRPDCLFKISQMAQVTEDSFNKDRKEILAELYRSIRYAKAHDVSIRICKLKRDNLRIIGFSDSSFANNTDLSSPLDHICFLGDDTNSVAPIHFKSYKSRRITRSAMAGEVIAFSDLFDVAATLAQELEVIMKRCIPIQLFTDSQSLFDVISKGSRKSEKRMMLDIAAAREGFKSHLISDIGFVRSSQNIADGLTKRMQQASLRNVLLSGQLSIALEQWVIRG